MKNKRLRSLSVVAGSNPVASKVYGLWGNRGHEAVQIDEVSADNVDAALRAGRTKWGKDVRSAILIPDKKRPDTTAEPMFLNE